MSEKALKLNPAQDIPVADELYTQVHMDEQGRVAQIDQYVPEVPKGTTHTGVNLKDVTGTGDIDLSAAKVVINQYVDEVVGRKTVQFKFVGTTEDRPAKDSEHKVIVNQRVGKLAGKLVAANTIGHERTLSIIKLATPGKFVRGVAKLAAWQERDNENMKKAFPHYKPNKWGPF